MNIEETNNKVKEIKQSFRLFMDGAVAKSMRDKGAQYHLNWGIQTTRLKEMATQYGKNYELAIALWKENIRECKILAIMIMPIEQMKEDLMLLWMEDIKTQEMAETACFYLFQHLSFAPKMAFKWMASNNDIEQLCAYLILARLFSKKQEPNERAINEFIDQAYCAIQTNNAGLQRAIYNCLQKFAELSDSNLQLVKNTFNTLNIEF